MKRSLFATGLIAVLALGACTTAVALSNIPAIVNDAEALLSTSTLSATVKADATDVLNGFEAVAAAYTASASTGSATTESTAISTATAAITQAIADAPTNAALQKDGPLAVDALNALAAAPSTESFANAAEAAVGTALIDELTGGTTAAAKGAVASPDAVIVADARKHIADLKG